MPDETVCKIRHLLEEHGLSRQMLEMVNVPQSQAVPIATGTIVDKTIIHAGNPVHGS